MVSLAYVYSARSDGEPGVVQTVLAADLLAGGLWTVRGPEVLSPFAAHNWAEQHEDLPYETSSGKVVR